MFSSALRNFERESQMRLRSSREPFQIVFAATNPYERLERFPFSQRHGSSICSYGHTVDTEALLGLWANRGESGCESGQAAGNLIEGRETVRARWSVTEKMLVAIQKFQQRPLDVMIPLVPGFEGEVLKASDRFSLRHLSGDHSAEKFECEVPNALFCGKTN